MSQDLLRALGERDAAREGAARLQKRLDITQRELDRFQSALAAHTVEVLRLRAEVALLEPKVLAQMCIGAMRDLRGDTTRAAALEIFFTSREHLLAKPQGTT
jgi:hypothetical protein